VSECVSCMSQVRVSGGVYVSCVRECLAVCLVRLVCECLRCVRLSGGVYVSSVSVLCVSCVRVLLCCVARVSLCLVCECLVWLVSECWEGCISRECLAVWLSWGGAQRQFKQQFQLPFIFVVAGPGGVYVSRGCVCLVCVCLALWLSFGGDQRQLQQQLQECKLSHMRWLV